MKLKLILTIIAFVTVFATACDQKAKESESLIPEMVTLSNTADSLSYAWGVNIGSFMVQRGFGNLNVQLFAEAAIAAKDSAPLIVSPEEAQKFLGSYQPAPEGAPAVEGFDTLSYSWGVNIGTFLRNEKHDSVDPRIIAFVVKQMNADLPILITNDQAQKMIMEVTQRRQREASAPNRLKGEEFLAENAGKEGVVVLESGMQYKVVVEGKGRVAQPGETVVAHYHGTLIDGTVFDSSYERNQPFEFAVAKRQVIQGWDEAFSIMPIGSKWTLYIPTDMAYGDNPRPGVIKPGMTLIFDVELLDIKAGQ
jgi:FKBP-type peptidyl-prolyl cis-trans isomerase FklB